MNKSFWDERYAKAEYVFGTDPNVYFKSVIDGLPPGKLLVPGAGEGRDAVFAATLGWKVTAVDMSESGKEKTLALARDKGVEVDYRVADIREVHFDSASFDAIASIFFHLPSAIRQPFHLEVVNWLASGGIFIAEYFNPAQLMNTSGGPKDVDMLSTESALAAELGGLLILENKETKTWLHEGAGHVGQADVVRFVGKKN